MSLELRGVSVRYGSTEALAGVDLLVPRNEPTALVGASAAGKSTALRLLAGFEPPATGEVWIGGVKVSAPDEILVPPHRRRLGMVFQDLALWPNLTAVDNAALGLDRRGLGRRRARERAREALAVCGIAELAARLPGTLSGGQQQRVALARAIAAEPAFLLLDEPFGSLDLVTKERLFEEIAGLARACSLTLLLVSHDPLEAAALCKAVVVLERGRVVEAGCLVELLQAPRSEILAAFRRQMSPAQAAGGRSGSS